MPSTVIQSYRYLTDERRLRITYLSGAVYDYIDVPPEVYAEMKATLSKGTFLNKQIKGHYSFEKVR